MAGRKTDRRVQYTKQVLKQSLLELMTTKPVGKITVTDICERADVNRGTFYSHYQDAYDLLGRIEDELMAEILASLEVIKQNTMQNTLHVMIEDILLSIERNKALCSVLFTEYGDKAFLTHIIDLAKEKSMGEWKRQMPGVADAELMRMYTFISNGSVALIQQWLQGDLPDTPHSLSAFIEQMSRQCLRVIVSGK